jgi:hypothetical protein
VSDGFVDVMSAAAPVHAMCVCAPAVAPLLCMKRAAVKVLIQAGHLMAVSIGLLAGHVVGQQSCVLLAAGLYCTGRQAGTKGLQGGCGPPVSSFVICTTADNPVS